jgi:transposase
VEAKQDVPPSEPVPAAEENAKPKGHGRRRLPKHLERKQVVYDLKEDEKQCPHCPRKMNHIGDEVSERLEYIPASLHVIEEVCRKYACEKGCTVVTAQKPMQPIEKGLPGPGLLSHVAVSKYADHLPLFRQTGMFERHGITLSRSTMCDWMAACAELVKPLYLLMKEKVLSSKAVQTDDTPVAVFDPDLTKTRLGRIWTYVGDNDHPYTVYDYTPTRCRDGPVEFLKEFNGYLQADAYSGYEVLYSDPKRDVTEVACWAHCRRKFYEAQSSDLMRSMVMLAYSRLIYGVEREAKDLRLDSEGRLMLRQAKSVPILDDIKAYLQREQPKVLPKSPEGQAISYALSNWEALIRYCEDGDLEIDNNGAERSLRGIAVGRKNWMFFGSDRGGLTAAVLTSFIITCKRNKIDPFAYLKDIFERISAHPMSRLEELLPDRWQASRPAASA